jgi:methylmalonyl-CoA/ethylmalonyl-CoA epimerase
MLPSPVSVAEIPFLGEDAAFDHVGLAVASIREAAGSEIETFTDPIQRVTVGFVNLSGARIEMVEPACPESPVAAALEREQRLLHLCFRVRDLEHAIDSARRNGFHCIGRPAPAVAFENRRIAWLFSRTYGLIELLEDGSPRS